MLCNSFDCGQFLDYKCFQKSPTLNFSSLLLWSRVNMTIFIGLNYWNLIWGLYGRRRLIAFFWPPVLVTFKKGGLLSTFEEYDVRWSLGCNANYRAYIHFGIKKDSSPFSGDTWGFIMFFKKLLFSPYFGRMASYRSTYLEVFGKRLGKWERGEDWLQSA